MAKAVKTRNPQDSTRRNVQHANKAFQRLDERITGLEELAHDPKDLTARLAQLEQRLAAVELRVDRKLGPEVKA
jgi:hypothetical protein